MAEPWQALLDWWFGDAEPAVAVAAARQRLWFGYRPEQDAEAREHFGAWVEAALAGECEAWAASPDGWLALILLLDQLPRMVFRGTPRAYAGDEAAQRWVRDGLVQGGDMLLPPIRRVFVYLVLEHAEHLALQEQAVAQFRQLHEIAAPDERALFADFLAHAERHRQVIARFGRFPHRNEILGRPSGDAERAFLAQPGSRF